MAEEEPQNTAHAVYLYLLILRIPPHHEVRSAVAHSMKYFIAFWLHWSPFLSRSERV